MPLSPGSRGFVELQVAYHAVAGREQGGAGEVEACLLEPSQRLGIYGLSAPWGPSAWRACSNDACARCIDIAKEMNEGPNYPRPACLVSGANASAVIGVEILVEQQIVAPLGVALKFFGASEDGPPAGFIAQEDASQTIADFARGPRTGSSAGLSPWGSRRHNKRNNAAERE